MKKCVALASALKLVALCTALSCVPAGAQTPESPFLGGDRGAPYPSVDGKGIYTRICQSCHMSDGKGGALSPAIYPALSGNVRMAARAYPAMLVVNGQGAMPAFGAMLSDEQVAAVVNYLRTSMGNTFADALTPTEVKSLRPAMQTAPAELRGR